MAAPLGGLFCRESPVELLRGVSELWGAPSTPHLWLHFPCLHSGALRCPLMLITAHHFIIRVPAKALVAPWQLTEGVQCCSIARRCSQGSTSAYPNTDIQPKAADPAFTSLSAAPEAQPSPQHCRGQQDHGTELSAPFFLPCALQLHSLHRL